MTDVDREEEEFNEPTRPEAPSKRSVLEEGIGLCLSGGGYRAMLFHVGSLWRLNECGLLPKLKRISSVSGGSITAGRLGLVWQRLGFDAEGRAQQFVSELVVPLRRLADHTIDLPAVALGAVLPGSIADQLIAAYRRHLFGDATLQDLPDDPPRFVINATNVQSTVLFRFMKPAMRDYRVGEVKNPTIQLAVAVAASAAFPPPLSPVRLELEEKDWSPADATMDLHYAPYTTNVILTDGGVYDNLGLETVWKRYKTILVSDGGGKLEPEPEPMLDWARHGFRTVLTFYDQIGRLRRRQLIAAFAGGSRAGAYWGIQSTLRPEFPLPWKPERLHELAATPTRLKRLPAEYQARLINWGYASCSDSLARACQEPDGVSATNYPYPEIGV